MLPIPAAVMAIGADVGPGRTGVAKGGWGVGLGGMEVGVSRTGWGVGLGGTEVGDGRPTRGAVGVGLGGSGVEGMETGRPQLVKSRTEMTNEMKIEQDLD
jgi:hypothetical protein